MSVSKFSLAAVAAVLLATSAQAADLIVADPVVEMASPASGISPYIGVIGTVGADTNPFGGIGVVIGADVDLSDVVFIGAEARGTAYFASVGYTGFELLGLGRLGLHASDTVDLYVTGGAGYFAAVTPPSTTYYTVGAGAEFAVTEDWTLRAEVTGSGPFGSGFDTGAVTLGALFKF